MARRARAVAAESGGEGSRSVRRALEMLELIMARGEPIAHGRAMAFGPGLAVEGLGYRSAQ